MTPTSELVARLVDSLMLVHPTRWSELVIHLGERHGHHVITEWRGRLDPHWPLLEHEWCDRASQMALLNRTVDQLVAAGTGSGWNGHTLVVLRPHVGPILVHGHNGFDASRGASDQGQPALMAHVDPDRLLHGLPMLEAIEHTAPAIGARHDRFFHALGPHARGAEAIDVARGTLTFRVPDGERTYPMQVIGSYSGRFGTWCWSWANRGFQTIPGCYADIRELCSLRRSGMGALEVPGFDTDAVFAYRLALLVSELLGGRVVHRVDRPDLTTFFALADEH